MGDQARRPAVPVTFSEPIARVTYAGHTTRGTGTSLKLPEKAKAGTVKVAVAARPWEKLGDPTTVHYFPPSKRPVALVSPAPGGRLDPGDQVRVTFSATSGASRRSTPRATGSAPTTTRTSSRPPDAVRRSASDVKLTLPHTAAIADSSGRGLKSARTATWTVPPASPLRLIQLLAEDGLPAGQFDGPNVAHTVRAQSSAAARPAQGRLPVALRATRRPSSRSSGSPRPAT